jgi:ankyrin repeat protein
MLVARSGLAHAAKVLLDAGADPNYMIPPLFPTAGMTPLIEAAWGSHKEVVDLLLTFKASAHSYRLCDIQSDSRYENGVTPLHMTPSAPIAKLLIENVGLNPLAKDCVGWTPISFAAYRGWAPATLSALLDASEDTGVDEFVVIQPC